MRWNTPLDELGYDPREQEEPSVNLEDVENIEDALSNHDDRLRVLAQNNRILMILVAVLIAQLTTLVVTQAIEEVIEQQVPFWKHFIFPACMAAMYWARGLCLVKQVGLDPGLIGATQLAYLGVVSAMMIMITVVFVGTAKYLK